MSYNEFAYYYDSLMDEDLYKEYKVFIYPFIKDCKQILEVGCGTGNMTIPLSQMGLNIYGTDLSEEMIELAEYKAERDQVNIVFDVLDMSDFTLDTKFDCVLCFIDSLNYLSSIEQIKNTFKCIYDALCEDGMFIFDVHSMHKINVTFLDYSEKEEGSDFYFQWNVCKIDEGKIKHHVIIHEDGEPSVDEIHIQTTYPVSIYIDLLKEAGFKTIEYYSDFHEYHEEDDRVIFVVRK